MERNADHFKDKAERQKIEAEIFLQMKNYVMCIETYFGMLAGQGRRCRQVCRAPRKCRPRQ